MKLYMEFKISLVNVVSNGIIFHVALNINVVSGKTILHAIFKISVVSVVSDETIYYMVISG